MKNIIKKIIPYLFILIALVGFFGYEKSVDAALPAPSTALQTERNICMGKPTPAERDTCLNKLIASCPISARTAQRDTACTDYIQEALLEVGISSFNPVTGQTQTPVPPANISEFQKTIDGGCAGIWNSSFNGCFLKFLYYVIFAIPSGLLIIAAYFFNILISLVIQSSMYDHGFIDKAWVVVRDLSNIFFILILLYVAIKTVLNMGGHETKSMITSVIIMAVLINFSLFFTKIVIDSSNILALIFYNRLEVTYEKDGKPITRPYDGVGAEKDIAGSMYKAFDATNLLTQDFLDQLSTQQIKKPGPGGTVQAETVKGLPFIPTLVMIIVSGGIMIVAAYALFTSGIFFIGRIIELWLLMIFSPFAFMSFAVPKLAHTEYGWDKWGEKLLSTAFMAPIFMFFMYLIFLLLGAGIFDGFLKPGPDAIGGGFVSSLLGGAMGKILNILLPALMIMGMLLKAKDMAKQGGGQFGEMVMSAAKVTGALAVGGTALGVAGVGRATVGSFLKGASTGDTAANRMVGAGARIAAQKAIISDPASTVVDRTEAKKAIWRDRKDQIKGNVERFVGIQGLRNRIGPLINQDQHNIEHASHARHELDEAAGKVAHGKKWNELNGEQRYQVRRQISRDRVVRDNSGPNAALAGAPSHVPGLLAGFGTRKWDALTTAERELVDRADAVGHDPATGHVIHGGALDQQRSVADNLINDAKSKQGIVSTVVQSSVNGTYDLRNIANIVAKEQSTGFAKLAAVLGGGLAMGMRGGFKQMGANFGKPEGKFLKDLSSTIADALKNAKINVDLSHVGEEQKEGHKGGGGHH